MYLHEHKINFNEAQPTSLVNHLNVTNSSLAIFNYPPSKINGNA